MADVAADSDFIPHINVQRRRKRGGVHPIMFGVFFGSLLAFLLELSNPGYSRYKSSCLDVRPQTGDRLCNLVSFSIPQGFMGRCLTLLAGYLLASLKATFLFFFLLTSHLDSHMYKVCMHADMHEKQTESVLDGVKALRGPRGCFFFRKGHIFCFLERRFTSSINP